MISSLTIVTTWIGGGGGTINPIVAWACLGAIVIITILGLKIFIKEKRAR